MAVARKSSAMAGYSPWKLPPEMITGSPSSLRKIIGLSVAEFSSVWMMLRTKRNVSCTTPCTCGSQRSV